MDVRPGVRLGRYEILAAAGAGGMGEVWKARDTQLGRDVAIKLIPAAFASDPRLRRRLEREAKALSALSHPHICTLHDIGGDGEIEFLVMEYCEGTTLADRLERGPLPLDQAVRVGAQIAAALSRAHRAGIVHRDLKPSNVMLGKSGVKLLDFGLANRMPGDAPPDAAATASLGASGELVGTVAYMAPEVLAGQEADARSDIFALGAVLYEMLTGIRPFSGDSRAHVIASVLEREPAPLREIVPDAPAPLEQIVARCLAKNREDRWESAHDLAEALGWIGAIPSRPVSRRARLLWIPVVATLLVAAAIAAWKWPRAERDAAPVRLSIALGEVDKDGEPATIFIGHLMSNVAISPDGSRIAYTAQRGGDFHLFVRNLGESHSVEVATSPVAGGPFFSPDGAWLGYFTPSGMMKVRSTGGVSELITRQTRGNARGAAWAPDGSIYYTAGASAPLRKVAASGGPSADVTRLEDVPGENSHRWPALLPGGKHLLFTIRTAQMRSFNEAKIGLLDLESGKRRVIFEGGSRARYVPPGFLLFSREGALHIVGFNLKTLSVEGAPKRVVEGVASGPAGNTSDYDVSAGGDLVLVPGPKQDDRTDLIRVDNAGAETVIGTLPFTAIRPQLSPDGRTLAVNGVFANDDIYLYDMETGVTKRLSFEPGDETIAVWTPDNARVIYSSFYPPRLMIRNADGSGESTELIRGTAPSPWACDGRNVIYSDRSPDTGWDIWLVPLEGEKRRSALVRTGFDEYGGRLSPDGRWLAYVSNESGTSQIFLRRLDAEGGGRQISTGHGADPRWSADGRTIFYRMGDEMFAVPVVAEGSGLRTGTPRRLYAESAIEGAYPAKDGFLALRPHAFERARPTRIDVVLGWTRELTSRAP